MDSNTENIMAMPSSLTVMSSSVIADNNVPMPSIDDVRSYNFPCTKCGTINLISVIPSNETCTCRYCGHKYSIFEVPKTSGVRSDFRGVFFPEFDDPAESRAERIRMVFMVGVGALAIMCLGYMVGRYYKRRNIK